MKKRLCLLLGLLICGLAYSASAQIDSLVPPVTGTWIDLHRNQYTQQRNRPIPFLTEGYWVREDNIQHGSPVIIHYYDGQNRELRTDTIRHKRLNLKRRVVVSRLNERLTGLLVHRQQQLSLSQPTP